MAGTIAVEAQTIVREAAKPIPAGETIKAQLRRAARALKYRDGDWRIKAAWYGEAGCWSAAAFEELKTAFENWKDEQSRKAERVQDANAAKLLAIAARLEGQDSEFHRQHADALRDLACRLSRTTDGEVK